MSFIQNILFLNHFVNVFIEFLYDRSHSSAVHGRMGGVWNNSWKSFKKDDKSAAINLKCYSLTTSVIRSFCLWPLVRFSPEPFISLYLSMKTTCCLSFQDLLRCFGHKLCSLPGLASRCTFWALWAESERLRRWLNCSRSVLLDYSHQLATYSVCFAVSLILC
jgi:hypothetical protein